MSRLRIAVTGVGLLTPLGAGREAAWNALLSGTRGSRWLTSEELGIRVPAGGELEPWWFGAPAPLGGGAPGGEARLRPEPDPASDLHRFALAAAAEGVRQAGLTPEELRGAGCVIGTSKIDLRAADRMLAQFRDPIGREPAPQAAGVPSFLEVLFPGSAASRVAAEFGCRGPCLAPVAACATGLVSLIRGAELIREGACRTVLAGGADASLHAGLLAAYRRLGVLARPGDDPAGACRPFDVGRTGFAVGEGGGLLVLEEWEGALERGAEPLAEWIDGVIGGDPSGLTSIDASGTTLARLLLRLLSRNDLSPGEVPVVNLHGTATRLNDLCEARALRRTFGPGTGGFPGYALKGGLGHLLGAAGAVETACGVLSLAEQILPPTANHFEPDPACLPLRLSRDAERADFSHLLKLSLGFGGHIAAALLKRA